MTNSARQEDLDRHPVATGPAAGGEVPVIDLGGPGAVEAIAAACRDWGFFQVVNHGVPATLVDAVWRETRGYFARPDADKLALSRTRGNPWGYYNNELTKNQRDKKEVFDLTSEGVDPIYDAANRWPADDGGFRRTMTAWFEACETLSLELLDALGLGLGLPRGYLRPFFAPQHTGLLRLNHYPVRDPRAALDAAPPPADLGVHHHTDAGALTVLLQDSVGGLQVYRDGFWHDVAPLEGAFVINTADMMQVWSNDRYRAPVHRVLAMHEHDRYSLPFFFNPSADCEVRPLEDVVDSTHPPRYRPIRWAEFRGRRTDGDYADYGPEVQIADYRIDRNS
ncbi:MAG: 2OG-Fe(II) oxygenase family protein [Woeseiaceae bacterium]|nr:2OG-Fe(II) oxygenase family protein [Woeseiaceae bacterium]